MWGWKGGYVEDDIELVLVVLPLQEGLPPENLREYAPHRPDVDRLCRDRVL